MSLQIELESLGHKVVGILKDETSAIQACESQKVDAILLDINLGSGKSGLEIGANIQAKHDIPILLMTGYEIEGLDVDDLALKIIGVTKKPVFAADLLHLIDEFIQDQHANDS